MDSQIAHDFHMRAVSTDRSKRDWQSCLTAEERKRVTALNKQIAKLTRELSGLRSERSRIQNRATVRAGNDR